MTPEKKHPKCSCAVHPNAYCDYHRKYWYTGFELDEKVSQAEHQSRKEAIAECAEICESECAKGGGCDDEFCDGCHYAYKIRKLGEGG